MMGAIFDVSEDAKLLSLPYPKSQVAALAGVSQGLIYSDVPANVTILLLYPSGAMFTGTMAAFAATPGVTVVAAVGGWVVAIAAGTFGTSAGRWSLRAYDTATGAAIYDVPEIGFQWGGVVATGAADATTVKNRIGDPTNPNDAGNIGTLTYQIGAPATDHISDDISDVQVTSAAVDTLTKAGGAGDLAAVKAVTDLLPNAGALTEIQLAAIQNLPGGDVYIKITDTRTATLLVKAVTDLLPDGGALTQIGIDADSAKNDSQQASLKCDQLITLGENGYVFDEGGTSGKLTLYEPNGVTAVCHWICYSDSARLVKATKWSLVVSRGHPIVGP